MYMDAETITIVAPCQRIVIFDFREHSTAFMMSITVATIVITLGVSRMMNELIGARKFQVSEENP